MVCHDDDDVLCGAAFIRLIFFQPQDQTVTGTSTPAMLCAGGKTSKKQNWQAAASELI